MDILREPVRRFEKNLQGRDFVCGDIHGCYDDLELYLKTIRFNTAKDRLFCVGDLFDRGPRSRDALAYLRKKWFYPVMGNHEHMFIELYVQHTSLYKHYSYGNGSEWQYRQSKIYLAELAKAVAGLPLIIKVDTTLILHARLPDVVSLEAIEINPYPYLDTIFWYRGEFPDRITIPGITRVYCGHTPLDEPEEHNGTINIDTGAFLRYWGERGKLTVREL
ncbi:MAG: metallophosphoesterase [Treponema sp.]|jgi:serine/threonine protein phosphatase 1|nr:metallophosphoesterase [Treponema sp.]